MKRIALTLFAAAAILISGSSAALATAPPGNDGDLCHGANQETCRPDPNPNGQDCEDHGNNVDGNDDHCASEAPSSTPTATPSPTSSPIPTPTLNPTPTPSESASSTPSVTPSETPSETAPVPSPSDSPNVEPTPSPSATGSTSSSQTSKPSSTPTPKQRVITPPSTDTEPDLMVAADSRNLTMVLAILSGIGTLAYLLIWKFKRPYHR